MLETVKAYQTDKQLWKKLQKRYKITQADIFRDGLAVWLERLNLESLREDAENSQVSQSVTAHNNQSL